MPRRRATATSKSMAKPKAKPKAAPRGQRRRDPITRAEAATGAAAGVTDAILGANPALGVSREDWRDAAAKLWRLFSTNPWTLARAQAGFGFEMLRIAAGRSDLAPAPGDKRFAHPVWHSNGYYRRVLQAYLAWTNALSATLDAIEADADDKARARFLLDQLIAAAAPINNPAGNPGFIDNALKTRGASILRGLQHLLDDVINNGGMPRQVDASGFQVGKNLAATRGAVVYRSPVCEVIQYLPTTARVDATPVLLVPPQINKYYIVDLTPDKSLIQHALDHGRQVFTISWRNPTAAQADWGLEAYVAAGKQAIDAVLDITQAKNLHLIAACAGGLTASVLLAHLYAAGQGHKIASAALMVTVLDTRDKTLLGLFASDTAVNAAIARSRARGVLDGATMQRSFAWLRPQDLVWNFVANNWVLGNDPPAFDILFWNNDSTRLPAELHADLLWLFRRNLLRYPGALKLLGTPIDLGKVTCDVFIVAGITDHITPWQACYRSTALFGGQTRFVLSSSGHIQAIVNPPGNPKAKAWVHDDYSLEPEAWLERAQARPGSWWDLWLDWTGERGSGDKPAPTELGSDTHPPADPAPGRYVFQR